MAWSIPSWLAPGDSKPSSTSTSISKSTSSFSSSTPTTSDGGIIPPNRNTREACYISRDLFFSCLDKHSILDAVKEDGRARELCQAELKEFERDCAKSWVKYFKEKRVMEWKRDETIKQIQKEDQGMIEKDRARKVSEKGKGLFG